jgi:hypothetical protein
MQRPAVEGYAGQLLYVLLRAGTTCAPSASTASGRSTARLRTTAAEGQAKDALAKKDTMQDAPPEQAADEPQQKEAPQAAPQQRVPAKR